MSFVLGWDKFKEIFDNVSDDYGRDFHGWEYDLHLGEDVYITSNDVPSRLTPQEPYVIIRPGEFALLSTLEVFSMPLDTMGFISVRFSYKKLGLINVSGFHVDPGYKGKVFFSVYNAGPNDIVMKMGDPVFMIFLLKITKDEHEACAVGVKERQGDGERKFTETVTAIQGKSVSLANNAERIARLEFYLRFLGTIAITIIGGLLTYILTKLP